MSKNYQMYIGGKWVDAGDKQIFEDCNPYNGEVFAYVPRGKRADATRAIEAAAAAFPEWSTTPAQPPAQTVSEGGRYIREAAG